MATKPDPNAPWRQIEALVGSAGCPPNLTLPALKTGGADRDSDPELWMFYDRIPEAFWFVQFVGRNMRNVRILPATKATGGADPIPLGTLVHEDEDGNPPSDPDGPGPKELGLTQPDGSVMVYENATERRAAELLAMVDNFPELNQRAAELLSVVGRGYLVGLVESIESYDPQGRRTGGSTVGLDNHSDVDLESEAEIVEWRIFSQTDLKKQKDRTGRMRWRLVGSDDTDEDDWLHPLTYVFPLIDRHPNEWRRAKSAFMAARDPLRRICQYQAAQQAIADSRLAMRGLLLIAADWQIPEPPDWDVEKQGKWRFEKYLHEAMIAPISNPGSSTAVAPLVVSVPFEFLKDGWAFIDFFSKWDEHLCKMIDQDLGRVAIAWDAPTPLMTTDGLQNTNHWNLWAIQESADVTTWRPLGSHVSSAWSEYLTYQLTIEDFPEEEIARLCAVADTSEIMSKANRTEEACALFEKGLLSAEATVLESGFAPDQMPSDAEALDRWLRQVALRTTNGNLQQTVFEMLGLTPGDIDPVAGADEVLADSQSAPDQPDMSMALSAVALAESAALEFVRSVGNMLRHQIPKGTELRSDVEHLEAWQVAPVLGESETARILDAQSDDVVTFSARAFFRLRNYLADMGHPEVHVRMVEQKVREYALAALYQDLSAGVVLPAAKFLRYVTVEPSKEPVPV